MPQPNVAADLVRIHRVITRGLQVTIEHTTAFIQEGALDTATEKGFASYVQTLVSVLHAHHLTEDETAFPYFRLKLVDAPYDVLAAEHEQMASILDEIEPVINRLAGDTLPAGSLHTLHRAFTRISEIWQPHIQREEESITPEKLSVLISEQEQVSLAKSFAQHTQKHAGPDYLVAPFILFNLSPEDRSVLSQAMPPVVVQELVPVVWKEMWEPMKPFFLP